jgi:tetratricopeptide (TPR) repeat protein
MGLSWKSLNLVRSRPHTTPVFQGRRAGLLAVAFVLLVGGIVWGQFRDRSQAGNEAEKAEAQGDTNRALDLYAKALASRPEWTEGWWKYGDLLYQDHRFQEAAQAFGRLTRLAPNNPLGFALLGLCEYELADWNNATLHLNKALNRGGLPRDISRFAAYHLGLALLRQRNQSGALLTFKLLFHQDPDYPGLGLALGTAELDLEEPPAATAAVFPAVQIAGSAALAILDGRPADAEKSYRDLIARFPNQAAAHLSFGLFLESQHRDDEATKEFTAETTVNPTSAVPWLWLARVAIAQQNPEAARSYVAHARELDPKDPLSFLIEGRSFMLEHRWEQALIPLRVAEDGAPQSSEVHYALASVYGALHRGQEADKERQLFLQAQSDDAPEEDTNR